MRKLMTSDMFKAMRLISEMGMKETLKELYGNVSSNAKPEEAGIYLIADIFERASTSKCEKLLYDVLSGPLEMDAKEIAEMDPFELFEKLKEMKDFIGEERLKSFFNSLAGMMR